MGLGVETRDRRAGAGRPHTWSHPGHALRAGMRRIDAGLWRWWMWLCANDQRRFNVLRSLFARCADCFFSTGWSRRPRRCRWSFWARVKVRSCGTWCVCATVDARLGPCGFARQCREGVVERLRERARSESQDSVGQFELQRYLWPDRMAGVTGKASESVRGVVQVGA